MSDRLAEQVYEYVRKIPAGKVTTYGAIATAIGKPSSARIVGSILKRNPEPFYRKVSDGVKTRRQQTPCHRVIRTDRLVGGYSGPVGAKAKLLKSEGVRIEKGRVDPVHLHNPLPPL